MKHRIAFILVGVIVYLAGWSRAAEIDIDYVPVAKEAPARRIPGGSRPCKYSDVRVWILAPKDHVGLTTHASPAIYWYLNQPTKSTIEIAVTPKNGSKPAPALLEASLKGPHEPGLHRLDLATAGDGKKPIVLDVGMQYEVVIEVAERELAGSANPVAFARVERIEPVTGLKEDLDKSDATRRPAVFAKQGVWYDAVAALNEAIAAGDPQRKPSLITARRKLLAPQGIIEDESGKISEAKAG